MMADREVSERRRATVIELYRAGRTSGEIFEMLKNDGFHRSFIHRTINRFSETGSFKDRVRCGRPRSVRTEKVKKAVAARVRRNPKRSIRKMSAEMKISRSSLDRVVKEELMLSSFKRRKVHHLNASIRKKRVDRSRVLKTRYANRTHENVLFTDEKIFTIEEATNSQNDRILARPSSDIFEDLRFVDRNHHPTSVMVWAGVSRNRRTKLIFVPPGVKISAETYRELILEPIVKKCGQKLFRNRPWTFQQDGAPAHTANVTQAWLRREIPDFWAKDEWPPSSPDLNPLDFCAWGILERNACAKAHTSLEALKLSLKREWDKIPQEVFRNAIDSFPSRLNRVISAKGGYIE